ncbi:MAG: ATP-binding protein, partial [candidate division NC10 bacterium]
LATVLEELLALLSSQATAQKIQVVTDLALGEAKVRMDRQQLTHAFMNVFLNAIQAMPDGGTLTVRAYQDSGGRRQKAEGSETRGRSVLPTADRRVPPGWPSVVIEVEDTGPGIPPEHLDRIFEPYFTTKEGGTGLGLALAHKIIQDHDGSIRVEGGVGEGATFVVTLPVVGAA